MANFKIGQRVLDFDYGEGIIDSINPYLEYPIAVKFTNTEKLVNYSQDGKVNNDDDIVSLYDYESFEQNEYRLVEILLDKYRRYLFSIDDTGGAYCFSFFVTLEDIYLFRKKQRKCNLIYFPKGQWREILSKPTVSLID
jgi:hypothetical protein